MDVGGMAMAGHKEEGGSKCTGTSCLDTQHPRKRTPDPADPNNPPRKAGRGQLVELLFSLHCSIIYFYTLFKTSQCGNSGSLCT